jgi:hypothetical protein
LFEGFLQVEFLVMVPELLVREGAVQEEAEGQALSVLAEVELKVVGAQFVEGDFRFWEVGCDCLATGVEQPALAEAELTEW